MGQLDAPAVVFYDPLDGLVLFGETHQLKADGIDQGSPTGFNDIVGDSDGGPTAALIGPFH